VLELPSVDVGGGWLIFGLPPAEVAVHPSDENDVHEFYLMCDDVEAFVAEMKKRGIACGPVQNPGWGLITRVTLPGGGKLGVYQPRHARPKTMSAGDGRRSSQDPRRRDLPKGLGQKAEEEGLARTGLAVEGDDSSVHDDLVARARSIEGRWRALERLGGSFVAHKLPLPPRVKCRNRSSEPVSAPV